MSKVIRISSTTEAKLLEYKSLMISNAKVTDIKKMIEESTDDTILRAAIETGIAYQHNRLE